MAKKPTLPDRNSTASVLPPRSKWDEPAIAVVPDRTTDEYIQAHAEAAVEFTERWRLMRLRDAVLARVEELPCESPIESAFLVWWYSIRRTRFAYHDFYSVSAQVDLYLSPPINPKLKYRADILLQSTVCCMYCRSEYPSVVVELDGHEFHERTKEQVDLRNQRDRVLQASGYFVFHYSGSFLHRDPVGCIDDLSTLLEVLVYKYGCSCFKEVAPAEPSNVVPFEPIAAHA